MLYKPPQFFTEFRDGEDICYILRVTERATPMFSSVDEKAASSMLMLLSQWLLRSDRPKSHAAIVAIIDERLHVFAEPAWPLKIKSKIANWYPDIQNEKDRDRRIFEHLGIDATIELNQYLSFRPLSDFTLGSEGGYGSGLDPNKYDWREYVRRGLLREE